MKKHLFTSTPFTANPGFGKAITRSLLKLSPLLFIFCSLTGYAQCGGIINTVAGDGAQGYSGDGAAATSAKLNYPYGVAVDASGNIYIADASNNRIRKVTASTGDISTVAGNGTRSYWGDGGPATSAELDGPTGVAVDASGNIYIADLGNDRVREVIASIGIINTVAGNGTSGYSGDGGPGASAELYVPEGVAVDASGNIYIADNYNNRIRKVTASTGIISTVAGNGTAGYSGDGGRATSAKLYAPWGVAVDASGNIYIDDNFNNRIRKVTASTGIISTVAGDGTGGYSGDGGAATSAEIYQPDGVAVDATGNIYIADEINNRIRKVTASTGIISTVAGNGTGGYSGDGGAATSAKLNDPTGVAVDASGNIYIADQDNQRVREVTAAYNLNIAGTTTGCGSVTLTASGLTTYTWSGGNNPDSATNTFTNSDTYAITATNTGCTVTDSEAVTVNPQITTGITGTTTGCNPVILTASGGSTYAWSSGNPANAATNNFTSSGSYTVSVTATADGCTATASVTVTVDSAPVNISVQGYAVICQNDTVVLSTNAVTGYSYQWTLNGDTITGATGISYAATQAGSYAVNVNSANCGSATLAPQVVTVKVLPTINPVPGQTLCSGQSVTALSFSGNTAGAVYSWTNNNTVIGLAHSGVDSIASFTTVNTDSVPVVATITATPLVPQYAYIPNAASNRVFVVNLSNNLVVDSIPVGKLPWGVSTSPDGSKVYITNYDSNTVSVINTATNMVAATLTLGTNPTGVTVSPDGSKVYVANSGSGTLYIISTATDTIIATITVGTYPWGVAESSDGSKVYVSNYGIDAVSVINTASNTVAAAIEVGSGPKGIAVSPDGSKVYVVNNTSGTVSVINTSTNTVTNTITVGSAPNGIAVSPDGSKVYVANGANGNGNGILSVINTTTNAVINAITVGNWASGVAVNFDGSEVYVTNSGANTVSVINTATNTVVNTLTFGLAAGPVSIGNFVNGSNGCSGTPVTFTITVNPSPTLAITGPATGCGSVTLTATGGSAYAWSGGIAPDSAANTFTSSGTYTVTASYSGACSATAEEVVTVNPAFTASITAGGSTTFCVGDSITLTASAGSVYLWNNDDTTQSISVKTEGSYTVTVSAGINCSASSTATAVTVNPLPDASITPGGPTTFCQGDSVRLSANTERSYLWSTSGTTQTITVSQSGNYSVTVTDANSCSAVSSPTVVTVNPVPDATVTSIGSDTICTGDSVQLTANAESGYLWNTGATTQTIISNQSGNYTVTVTNAENCTAASAPTTVTVSPLPTDTISATGATSICPGGSVQLTANAESSYLWSTSATTQSIILYQAGSFSVTVTDANGCTAGSAPTRVSVDTPAIPIITAGGPTTFCFGDSVLLGTNNGRSYLWSNNETTQNIVISQQGSYSVIETDANGCMTMSDSVLITVNPGPTAIVTASGPTVFCANDSVELTVNTVLAYLWSNSSSTQNIVVNQSGNYTVQVTDTNGCTAVSLPTTITVNPLPVATITADSSTTFCQGDSVTLTASNGTVYLWSNNQITQSINVTQGGSYSVVVTDTNNCSALSSVTTVTVNTLPVAVITPSGDTTFCAGGGVTLTSSAGVTYLWSNSATTQSILVTQGGSFTVIVANVNDCSAASTAILITVNPAPTVSITPTSVSFCTGGSATLTAGGGVSYAWSNSANSNVTLVAPTTTTTYTVTVTGNDGCSDTASRVVTINALPDAIITPPGNVALCEGDSVALSAPVGDPDYLWSNNATTQIIFAKFTGTYSVTVTDINNCSAASAPDTVTVNPLPAIPIITETTETDDVLTSTKAFAYQWYMNSNLLSSDTSRQLTITQNGQYQVEISDSNGCTNISSVFNATGTGIGQIASVYDVKLYPNPNNGNFALQFSDGQTRFVSLFDVTGRLISTQQVAMQKDFDCSALTGGVYYLEIKDENGVKALNVVISK